MFCKYCGRQLADGEVCGCRQQKKIQVPRQQVTATQWEATPENGGLKQKKHHKGLIIGLIAAAAILIAAASSAAVILLYDAGDKKPKMEVQIETKTEGRGTKEDTQMSRDESKTPKSESENVKDSTAAKLKADYESGMLDYIQLKKELESFDASAVSKADANTAIELQTKAETDLTKKIEGLAREGRYMEAFSTLAQIQEKLPEDKLAAGLKDKYEAGFILYLDSESKKLVKDKKTEDAVKMLTEAKGYVSDKVLVDELIESVQTAPADANYIIADSNSRYLTRTDVAKLSLREINYAKNEIYARRGRRFTSKELQDYFNSKSWYNGTIDANAFDTSVFNDYERANAEFLSEVEFSVDSAGYKLDAG